MKHDLIVLFGWLIATAIINVLLRVRTVEEWEALAEKSPRYAAFARIMRAIGLDPVKLLQSLVDFVRGKAGQSASSKEASKPSKEGDAGSSS